MMMLPELEYFQTFATVGGPRPNVRHDNSSPLITIVSGFKGSRRGHLIPLSYTRPLIYSFSHLSHHYDIHARHWRKANISTQLNPQCRSMLLLKVSLRWQQKAPM
jgi:hypothetical protein